MFEYETYWNTEDDDNIICPYCGNEYEPTYDETIIGDKIADCFTEKPQIFTCSYCFHRFTMTGYLAGWKYVTETIDGEMTEQEHEDKVWMKRH